MLHTWDTQWPIGILTHCHIGAQKGESNPSRLQARRVSNHQIIRTLLHFFLIITIPNKKVLLRERKRHTARRIISARSAVTGGIPQSCPGGTPVLSWPGGTPFISGLGVPYSQLGDWGTSKKDLGPETWERTYDWGTPLPGVDRHLWKQYLPHASDADGKK